MSALEKIALAEIMASKIRSVDPSKCHDEVFDLYSIPAFDKGKPEVIEGRRIGSAKQIVQPGDVLLSKIVPHIRRSWIVGENRGRRLIGSGEWIVFRSKKVLPEYLRHVLVADPFHVQFMSTVSGVGGSLLRARPAQVANIEILLPPLDEQRRIAAILDKADAIRCKRKESIRLMEEFLRTTFLEMFGDPVMNPKGWNIKRLGAVIRSIDSGWSANGSDRQKKQEEWAVLKISSVTSGRFMPSEYKVLDEDIPSDRKIIVPKRGDLLLSRANTRELVAATCLVESDQDRIFLPDKLWRIIPNPELCTSAYLRYLLANDNFREQITKKATGTSGSMLNISMGKVRDELAPIPPLALQKKFTSILWKCFDSRNQIECSDAKIKDLFDALTHHAYHGEL